MSDEELELNNDQVPFQHLSPDVILNAISDCGYVVDGTFIALNSYENRVYQVGIEDDTPVVVKFYRPGRWSNEAILEEHSFSLMLAGNEIPLVPPVKDEEDQTLHEYQGYRFSIFLRKGGRWPELDKRENLSWIGRFIGRIHAVGAVMPFQHRITLGIDNYGVQAYQFLLEKGFLPLELETQYRDTAEEVLQYVEQAYVRAEGFKQIRLHGDCHPGNILWTDQGPHFVDLDDCCTGPAIQDIWMLLSGSHDEMCGQLSAVLQGYCEFMPFDARELHLLEALRTLRMIHYSAWLARRWDDPAFLKNFTWFNTRPYWEEQIHVLQQQSVLINEAPLEWYRA